MEKPGEDSGLSREAVQRKNCAEK